MGSLSKVDVLQQLDMRVFFTTELRLKKHARNEEVTVSCPFHDDHSPSFSVNLDTGLWVCHAGCGGGNVIDFVMKRHSLSFSKALQELAKRIGRTAGDTDTRKIIRSFPWIDAQGRQAWKHRWNTGDKFSWSKDQAGTQNGQGGCCPTLYHLESLTDATDVMVVEGERDVETISQLLIGAGLNTMRATCTPNGAQSVKPDYFTALQGKAKVWISGDNDDAGNTYRDRLAMQLHGKVGALLDLRVPAGFKDWTEWVERAESGDRVGAFRELVSSAGAMSAPMVPWRSSIEVLKHPAPETAWLIHGILPAGGVVLLSGREGSMKSWLALRWAHAVAEGTPWLGRRCAQGNVLYLDKEMPPDLLRKRLRLGIGGSERLHVWGWTDPGFQFPKHLDGPYLTLAAQSHCLIVVDTLRRFMDGLQENSADDMAEVSEKLRELTRYGATVVVLHHSMKDEEKRGYRGSTELGAGVDIVMSLVNKKGEVSLRTEKTRYGEPLKLDLSVSGSYDNPAFEDRTDGSQATTAQLMKLRGCIEDLAMSLGRSPNQSEVCRRAEHTGLGRRQKVLGLLQAGKDAYWQSQTSGKSLTYSVVLLSVLSVPIEQEPKQIEEEEERKTPEGSLSVQSGGSIDTQTDSEIMKRVGLQDGELIPA